MKKKILKSEQDNKSDSLNELRATIGSIWPSGWMVNNTGSYEQPQSYDDYYEFEDSKSKTIQDSMSRFNIYEDEDWVNEMNKQLKLQKRKGEVKKAMFKEEDDKDDRELLVDEEEQDGKIKIVHMQPEASSENLLKLARELAAKKGYSESETQQVIDDMTKYKIGKRYDYPSLVGEFLGHFSEFVEFVVPEDQDEELEEGCDKDMNESIDINIGRVLKEAGFSMSPISSMGAFGVGRYDDEDEFEDDSIDSDDPDAPYDPDDYLPSQYGMIECPNCGELTYKDDLVCDNCGFDRGEDDDFANEFEGDDDTGYDWH